MPHLLKKIFFRAAGWLLIVASLSLGACGSSGQPFIMNLNSTIIVGDGGPGGILNPVQQVVPGTLTAEILDDLHDRFNLEITDFQCDADFAGVGPIHMILDPNFTSTATVFKLNRNNNPFGVNIMDLSLIVETPDQNLTLTNISLSSDSSLLVLDQSLPALNFFVGGQPKVFNLSALEVQIPVQLIVSTSDPQ